MSVWWFWILLSSSSCPQRTWDALSVWRGRVTPGSVRVRPIRAQTRGLWAEQLLPLYPVPAAARFCSNSEVRQSELYRGALTCHSPNEFIKRWQRPCRSCQAHSSSVRFSPTASLLEAECVFFLHFGRLKLFKRGEQGVWKEREDFFFCLFFFSWTGSLPVSPEYDCCHVQWGDICTCCLTERRERRLCYSSSSSSLDIYGEGLLLPALELLAAEATPRVLNSPTWIAREDTLNLIWMPLQGVCWFLCCRQGFSLLGRDYGEKEEEESFELRNKEDLTPNGRVRTLHLHCTGTHVHEYLTHTHKFT